MRETPAAAALVSLGFAKSVVDEFGGIDVAVVQAAIDRCDAAEGGRGAKWQRKRRRQYILGALRAGLADEVAADIADQAAQRTRIESTRAKREEREAESKQRQRVEHEREKEQARADDELLSAAAPDDLSVILDQLADENAIARRRIRAERDKGAYPLAIARLSSLRAVVCERLRALHKADATAAAGAP